MLEFGIFLAVMPRGDVLLMSSEHLRVTHSFIHFTPEDDVFLILCIVINQLSLFSSVSIIKQKYLSFKYLFE